MTLMLHAGAEPVDYDALRALTTPEPTATHVPIPHFRVVDMLRHTLAFYGHEVIDEHFGVTPDGLRFFGLLSLRSSYGAYEDTVALRNSHDKKFPVGIGFGGTGVLLRQPLLHRRPRHQAQAHRQRQARPARPHRRTGRAAGAATRAAAPHVPALPGDAADRRGGRSRHPDDVPRGRHQRAAHRRGARAMAGPRPMPSGDRPRPGGCSMP